MDPSKEITLIDIIGILKLLVDKVDSMNHKIDELNQRMEIYEQSAQAQDEKIEFLQHLTKEQDTKIKELEDNIDELNQHHLSNKIVLSGPKISELSTSTTNIQPEPVSKVINESLGTTLNAQEISNVSILGKTGPSLIVELADAKLKRKIFANIKNSNNQIFANDFLTKKRSKIFTTLKKIRRSLKTVNRNISVFTRKGTPAVKIQNENSLIFIRNELELENFKNQYGIE